jgi:hypothetical protein
LGSSIKGDVSIGSAGGASKASSAVLFYGKRFKPIGVLPFAFIVGSTLCTSLGILLLQSKAALQAAEKGCSGGFIPPSTIENKAHMPG